MYGNKFFKIEEREEKKKKKITRTRAN